MALFRGAEGRWASVRVGRSVRPCKKDWVNYVVHWRSAWYPDVMMSVEAKCVSGPCPFKLENNIRHETFITCPFFLSNTVTMYPNLSPRAFKPRQASSKEHSTNAKTVRNRLNQVSKRGIDAALLKADGAFRRAKSRALQKLRQSPGWGFMSAEQQARAERDAIRPLETRRDYKRRHLEMEWRYKVEEGMVDPDEDDLNARTTAMAIDEAPSTRKRRMEEEEVLDDDGDESWEDCEGQEDWDRIGTDLFDIHTRYERKQQLVVRTLNAQARCRKQKYRKYKELRNAERMDIA